MAPSFEMACNIMFGDMARAISVGFDSCFDRAFTIWMSEDLILVTGTNFEPRKVYKLSTSFVDPLATNDVLFSPFFERIYINFVPFYTATRHYKREHSVLAERKLTFARVINRARDHSGARACTLARDRAHGTERPATATLSTNY